MQDLKLPLMQMAMDHRDFSRLWCRQIGDIIAMTIPGYSVKQSIRWKYPVIIRRKGWVMYEGATRDAYFGGHAYQLYEDANDVAGLGELLAHWAETEVPALREGR